MSNDLSFLTPVQPEQGKAQWVHGKDVCIGVTRLVAAAAMALALTGCSLGGLAGPYPGVPELQSKPRYDIRGRPEWVPPSSGGGTKTAAPPRVLYRIDANRYFEDASEAGHFCENGSPIYYVDRTLGIRTYVVKMDGASMGVNFIIDAANDQYLIGPVTRGNTDCSSGGGSCKGASMPYSTDAGRTWTRVDAGGRNNLLISGSIVYDYGAAPSHYDFQNRSVGSFVDIATPDKYAPYRWVLLRPRRDPDWTEDDLPILKSTEKYLEDDRASSREMFNIFRNNKAPKIAMVPQPRLSPIDTKFHCAENGKEQP